jgi:hypothetical protein
MLVFMKFFVALVFVVFASPSAFANVHGVFQVVKGKVQVKSGKDGKTERAKIGQKIFPKDTIFTGPDSRAKIVMVDTNVINVSPDSTVVLENYEFKPGEQKKNVLLNVIYGKVRSKVNQKYDGDQAKFQVKTKSAVAGVRGTDFLASFNPEKNESQVVTFEGEVEFGKPGPNGTIQDPVSVGVGQMADQVASAPPSPPREVPPQMLASLDTSSDAEKAEGSSDERQPAAEKDKDKDKDEKENKAEGSKDDKGKGGNSEDAKSGNKTDTDTNKDEKKGGGGPPVGGANNTSGAGDNRAGVNSPTVGDRTPAAIEPGGNPAPASGGTGMFLDSDFAGGGGDAVMVGDDQVMSPAFDPVVDVGQINPNPAQIECEFCNRLIEEGTARVLIQIQNGSNP